MKDIENIEFITFDKRHSDTSRREIGHKLRNRRFPILLHMHASMRANLLTRRIDADLRLGFDRARARDFQWLFTNAQILEKRRQHVMDGLFGFAEALGIERGELRWDIPLGECDQALAAATLSNDVPVCIISPCSSQRARNYRNWPAERYAALADRVHADHGAQIVLSGGPTRLEHDYGQQITSMASCPIDNLIGRTNLKELLALIARASVLVCPDSGPAHMATAVATPVVGLYATSNRHRTGPYLSQSLVVDKYPEAIRAEFDKPVDKVRWGQRVRDPEAMSLIETQDVLDKIKVVLGTASAD